MKKEKYYRLLSQYIALENLALSIAKALEKMDADTGKRMKLMVEDIRERYKE